MRQRCCSLLQARSGSWKYRRGIPVGQAIREVFPFDTIKPPFVTASHNDEQVDTQSHPLLGRSYHIEFWPQPFQVSSDPESHPKVGFESVSGFGFRVSSIETTFRCRFRVSGFGFRRLKPTFAVGFGFRVSGFVDCNPLSLSVSGFGFRRLKPTFAVGFGFRV